MYGMFSGCSSLKELNLSNFNFKNAYTIHSMFYECPSLIELNLPNFNINNDVDIHSMFYGCSEQFIEKIKSQYDNLKEEGFN